MQNLYYLLLGEGEVRGGAKLSEEGMYKHEEARRQEWIELIGAMLAKA